MEDPRIIRIEDKIDKLVDHIGSIDVTLAKQHVSLVEHIKRTALLEEEIKPLKERNSIINAALKILGSLAVVVTFVATVFQIVSYIRK